jgi:hypothetical protein
LGAIANVEAAPGDLGAALVLLVAAVGIFVAAVWFGVRIIAPRLGRAFDRAESEDELDGDGHD